VRGEGLSIVAPIVDEKGIAIAGTFDRLETEARRAEHRPFDGRWFFAGQFDGSDDWVHTVQRTATMNVRGLSRKDSSLIISGTDHAQTTYFFQRVDGTTVADALPGHPDVKDPAQGTHDGPHIAVGPNGAYVIAGCAPPSLQLKNGYTFIASPGTLSPQQHFEHRPYGACSVAVAAGDAAEFYVADSIPARVAYLGLTRDTPSIAVHRANIDGVKAKRVIPAATLPASLRIKLVRGTLLLAAREEAITVRRIDPVTLEPGEPWRIEGGASPADVALDPKGRVVLAANGEAKLACGSVSGAWVFRASP
jgi:hypothetical protein